MEEKSNTPPEDIEKKQGKISDPVGIGNKNFYAAGVSMDALEELCRLNLEGHFPDVTDFCFASWNLSSLLTHSVGKLKLDKLSVRQKVSILFIGKSQRLLRSIFKLVSLGMWPEAEIILRILLEAKVLLMYILENDTQERAVVWMSRTNPNQRWSWSEISNGSREAFRTQYSNLSLYLHGHVLSSQRYVGFQEGSNFFMEVGPLGNEASITEASKILGSAAMMNGAICELARYEFPEFSEWEKQHEELMAMPYFQSCQPKVQELLKTTEGKAAIERIIRKRNRPG